MTCTPRQQPDLWAEFGKEYIPDSGKGGSNEYLG